MTQLELFPVQSDSLAPADPPALSELTEAQRARAGRRLAYVQALEGLPAGACGADAVNNAVASVAFARQYLKDEGIDVYFVPEFEKAPVGDGGERTVVLFRVCKAAGSAATGVE